jgi:hypothetical protein
MADAGKYGIIVIPGIPDMEPVFVLRAQDRLALALIDRYKARSVVHGVSKERILGIDAIQAKFIVWQKMNPTRIPGKDFDDE